MRKKSQMSYSEFYKVVKKSGTVKKALRDDAGFRKWYEQKRK
jgi:hypothetical protein